MIEISENECLVIVRTATGNENVKIENFSAEHFGDFLGYLGEYYRLKITAKVDDSTDLQFQFFVKSLPIIDMRSRREMLIESGIFRKEMKIYENLLQKFVELDKLHDDNEMWCPKIYLVRDDLIVFEDLTTIDYKVLPFGTFDFTEQHVEATLKSLANLHACSIAYEEKEKISIGKEFSDILFETSICDIPWFTAGLDIIKIIAKDEVGIENSDKFYDKIFGVIEVMEKSPFDVPKVLCHRDIWKNNLMFRDDPLNCVLIDFQTSRYLSLSVDVTMAIICTSNRNHYEKLMSYYLQFYYQHLERKLSKFSIDLSTLMNYEVFLQSCEYHKKVLLVYKTFVVSLTQVPQELFKNFSDDDYRDFASGDRYRLVKKFMEQDETFKERLLDAVGAVIEGLKDVN
ncbi:uncharacterized protein [Chironomus tepperi]|uniref:uncharacterized protein n=1 Tax=Chironomus tepperi TaxID=113505 RepID=UPI00391F0640